MTSAHLSCPTYEKGSIVTNNRRREHPDALQHVIAHGVHGDRLVPNAEWATELYNCIAREAHERGWQVWSFVIMGTHYHLLVETPDGSLAAGLQRAHSAHAIRRNRHEDRRKCAVFGRRYDSFGVEDGRHLRNALRYIPRNPVVAGLCRDPADWPFGTFRALAGLEPCPAWVPKSRIFQALEGPFRDSAEPWFGESHYARMCRSRIAPITPPLRVDDWNRYRSQCLREDGAGPTAIAAELGLSVRHARRLANSLPEEIQVRR